VTKTVQDVGLLCAKDWVNGYSEVCSVGVRCPKYDAQVQSMKLSKCAKEWVDGSSEVCSVDER
jgi:hypothetical protein